MLVCTATVIVDVSSYRLDDIAWNKKADFQQFWALLRKKLRKIMVRRNKLLYSRPAKKGEDNAGSFVYTTSYRLKQGNL